MSKRKIYILLTKIADKGSKAIQVLTGCVLYKVRTHSQYASYTAQTQSFRLFLYTVCCPCFGVQWSNQTKERSNRYFSDALKRLSGMKLRFQGNLKTIIKHFGIVPNLA